MRQQEVKSWYDQQITGPDLGKNVVQYKVPEEVT